MQSPHTKSMVNKLSGVMPLGTTYAANGVLRADGSAHDDPSLGTPTGIWNGIVFSTPNSPSPATGLSEIAAAVPEPSTRAMALAGLAAAGLVIRRRRQRRHETSL